jgi:hypothetical protein
VRPNGGSDPGPLIRPYAITGGRTEARADLAVEDLVTTVLGRWSAAPNWLDAEHGSIAALCARRTISVAEIAARLGFPLGVTRILVGDLADEGIIEVYRAQEGMGADGRPDANLLQRVLAGLYSL